MLWACKKHCRFWRLASQIIEWRIIAQVPRVVHKRSSVVQAESDGQNEVHVQAKEVLQPEDILTYVVAILGEDQVKVHQSPFEFELIFWLDSLPSLQADALGLPGENAINMHIKLPFESDNEGQHRPAFKFSIGGEETALHIHWKQPRRSKVLYQLSKNCEAFIAEHWPCKSEDEQLTFLVRLYRHIQVSILQLGKFCVICGTRQVHNGLKPVPCNLEACNHAFDEHGIGTDLRDIYSRPAVADLLITMASAACRCTSRRDSLFQSLPSELDLNTVHSGNNIQVSPKINWHCMKKAFASFPSVATMASMQTLEDMFSNLSLKAGVRLRLMRSVLNSCRGHLMASPGSRPTSDDGYWVSVLAVHRQPTKGSGICTAQITTRQSVPIPWLTILQLALHPARGSGKKWAAAVWCQLGIRMVLESILQKTAASRHNSVGTKTAKLSLPTSVAYLGELHAALLFVKSSLLPQENCIKVQVPPATFTLCQMPRTL